MLLCARLRQTGDFPIRAGLEQRTLWGRKVAASQRQLLPERTVALFDGRECIREVIDHRLRERLFSEIRTSSQQGSPRATFLPGIPGAYVSAYVSLFSSLGNPHEATSDCRQSLALSRAISSLISWWM